VRQAFQEQFVEGPVKSRRRGQHGRNVREEVLRSVVMELGSMVTV